MVINKKEEFEGVNLRQGNISLILDSYDDLFSDFDPRPYSEKALSDDFLVECRRAARQREDVLELRLLVPAHKRKAHDEVMIKKRLKDHFKKHFREEEKETREIRKGGIVWFFVGSIILMISTFLYEYKINGGSLIKFLFNFLVIISQPAGWFTLWEGLNRIFVEPRKNKPDYEFYKKMSDANVYFLNY
jgi:hypothetical protein